MYVEPHIGLWLDHELDHVRRPEVIFQVDFEFVFGDFDVDGGRKGAESGVKGMSPARQHIIKETTKRENVDLVAVDFRPLVSQQLGRLPTKSAARWTKGSPF